MNYSFATRGIVMSGNILGFKCEYEGSTRGKSLVVETEEKHSGKLTNSEIQMLRNYEIYGVLPLEVKYINNRANLCYDINEKKTLTEIINGKRLNFQEYIKILYQITRIVNSSKKYFLNESNFVLDINYIFAAPDYNLALVYLPMVDQPAKYSVINEMNKIVSILYASVDNQYAIPAKKIFDDFFSGNYSLLELSERLNKENEQFLNQDNKAVTTKNKRSNSITIKYRILQIVSLVIAVLAWILFIFLDKLIIMYGAIGVTVLAAIVLFIMQKYILKSRVPSPPVPVSLPNEDRLVSRVHPLSPNIHIPKVSHDTVALYNDTSAFIKSACLVVNSGGESIGLNALPLIVGRGKKIDSYLVDDTTVSGNHARIEKDTGRYMITDLGSTNKTFINDSMLEPQKSYPLNNGDIIRMGRTDFTFQEEM